MSIKKKSSDDRLNILISTRLKQKYKIYCIENDFNLSERIRFLIELDLNHKIVDGKIHNKK